MWLLFNSVCFVQCVGCPTNWGAVLRTNTVQHTECVQVNMSLDVTGNILDQQALSLELLSNSTKGAHSISCNIESTLLPWNFSYILYIYIYITSTVERQRSKEAVLLLVLTRRPGICCLQDLGVQRCDQGTRDVFHGYSRHITALPSGNLLRSYWKWPFLMGNSTISMAIFNSYVTNYQRVQ